MVEDFDFDKVKAASMREQDRQRELSERVQAEASRKKHLKQEANTAAATDLATRLAEVLEGKTLQGDYPIAVQVDEDDGDGARVRITTTGGTCLQSIDCSDGGYNAQFGGRTTNLNDLVVGTGTMLAQMSAFTIQQVIDHHKRQRR